MSSFKRGIVRCVLFLSLAVVCIVADAEAENGKGVLTLQDGRQLTGVLTASQLKFKTDISPLPVAVTVEKIIDLTDGRLNLIGVGRINGRFVSGEFILFTPDGEVRHAATEVVAVRRDAATGTTPKADTSALVFSVTGAEPEFGTITDVSESVGSRESFDNTIHQLYLTVTAHSKTAQQGGRLDLKVPMGERIYVEVTAQTTGQDLSKLDFSRDPFAESNWLRQEEQMVWYLNQLRQGTGKQISLNLEKREQPYRLDARVEFVPSVMPGSTPAIAPAISDTMSSRSAAVEIKVTEQPNWACRGRLGVGCKGGVVKDKLASESEVIWDKSRQMFLVKGRMSIGAIKHDKCCDEQLKQGIVGFWCDGGDFTINKKTVCEIEWEQATWDHAEEELLLPSTVHQWDFTWVYPSDPNDKISPTTNEWWTGLAPGGAKVNQVDPDGDRAYCQSNHPIEIEMTSLSDDLVTGPPPGLEERGPMSQWVCGDASNYSNGKLITTESEFIQLNSGVFTGRFHSRKQYKIIASQSKYNEELLNYSKTAPASIDFTQGRVLLVGMGRKGSLGYSIRVTSIDVAENYVTANVNLTKPGKNCRTQQAFSNPYQFVFIPTLKEILVKENLTIKLCPR